MNTLEFLERVQTYTQELEALEKAGTFQTEQQRWQLLNSLPETVRPQVASQLRTERRIADRKVGSVEQNQRVASRRASEGENSAMYDPNTRLLNLASYRRHQMQKAGWTHLHIDLTHFKNVNDTLGHPSGDAALQSIARLLHQATSAAKLNRRDVLIHRTGGDEFVVMTKTPLHAALFARAFRHGLDSTKFGHATPAPGQEQGAAGDSIQASATMGIGRTAEEADTAEAIAKHRKNQNVAQHLSLVPPEAQETARAELLRSGQANGKSLIEIHSLLPGFDGPIESDPSKELDARWSAPHARKPIASASLKDAHLNPVARPKAVDAGMRSQVSVQKPV